MIQNNNLSPLPFYENPNERDDLKPWAYGRVPCLAAPSTTFLPWFVVLPDSTLTYRVNVSEFFNANTGNRSSIFVSPSKIHTAILGNKIVMYYNGNENLQLNLPEGRYYWHIQVYAYRDDSLVDEINLYSEIFTVIKTVSGEEYQIPGYTKIEWYDDMSLEYEEGFIPYTNGYKNFLFLPTDIGMPDYLFDEEATERDGFTFVSKQLSEKRYKFVIPKAPEYMCDALRLVRLSDHIRITDPLRRVYNCDNFLMTVNWLEQGHYAVIKAEFETNTVVKKISASVIGPQPTPYVILSQSIFDLDQYSSTQRVGINTNIELSDLQLVVVDNIPWITNVRFVVDEGANKLSLDVAQNVKYQQIGKRIGNVNIVYNGNVLATLIVNQAAATPILVVETSTTILPTSGGEVELNIVSHNIEGIFWDVAEIVSDSWMSDIVKTETPCSVRFNVGATREFLARDLYTGITINGNRVYSEQLRQNGARFFSLSSPSQPIVLDKQAQSVTMIFDSGLIDLWHSAIWNGNTYDVEYNIPSWITLINAPEGTSHPKLLLDIPANNSGQDRTGNITVTFSGALSDLSLSIPIKQTADVTLSTNLATQVIGATAQNLNNLYASSTYAGDTISVVSNSNWCSVVHDSGTNPYNFHLAIDANYTGSIRTATITISTGSGLSITRTISQTSASASLTTNFEDISDNYESHNYTGFTASSSNPSDVISVTSDESWAVVTKSGTNPVSFSVAVSENDEGYRREATITISTSQSGLSQTYTISQAKHTYSIVVNPPMLEWEGNETQTKYATVTTDAPNLNFGTIKTHFDWSYDSSTHRISVTPVAPVLSGSDIFDSLRIYYDNATAYLVVSHNVFEASLTTTLTSQSNISSDGAEYEGTVESSLSSDIISASVNQSWMHVHLDEDVPQNIVVTIDPNETTSPRTGTLTISTDKSGKTITRTYSQLRKENYLTIEPSSGSYPSNGGNGTFHISANCPFTVDVESGKTWCRVSERENDIDVIVDANTSTSDRNANIYVRWTTSDGVATYATYHVLQAGASVTPIEVEIISGTPIPAAGGYVYAQVTYDGDWQITAKPSWIDTMEYYRSGDWNEISVGTIVTNSAEVRFHASSNISASAVQRSGDIDFEDSYSNTDSITITQIEAHPAPGFDLIPRHIVIPNYMEGRGVVNLISSTNWNVRSILYGPYDDPDDRVDGSSLLTVTPTSGGVTTTSGINLTLERITEQEDENYVIEIEIVIPGGVNTITVYPNEDS